MPPKRKLTGPRTSRRFATFRRDVVTKLTNRVRLTACQLCGSQKLMHTVCPTCGGYGAPKKGAAKKPASGNAS